MEENQMIEKKKGSAAGWLKGIGYSLLMIVIFYAIQFAIAIPVMLVYMFQYMSGIDASAGIDPQALVQYVTDAGGMTVITACSTVVTAIVFGLWYYFKYGKKSQRKLSTTMRESFAPKKVILYIIAAFFCFLMALNVVSIINIVSPESYSAYENAMQMISSGNQGILLLTVVVLAPIGEECIFRGLLLKKFRNYISPLCSILICAVMFGVFHMNLVQGIYVLFVGTVAGYAAYKSDSVLPAIFIHLVYNFSSFLLQLFPESILSNDLVWVFAPLVPLVLEILLFKAFGMRISFKSTEQEAE